MSEIESILTKLKIVSEEKENGMYLCDKEHSKILLDYIQQKENIIKELDKVIIEFKKQIEEERKNCRKIIGNFVDKVKELKGSNK